MRHFAAPSAGSTRRFGGYPSDGRGGANSAEQALGRPREPRVLAGRLLADGGDCRPQGGRSSVISFRDRSIAIP
jgi:hypothetical protein